MQDGVRYSGLNPDALTTGPHSSESNFSTFANSSTDVPVA